MLGQPISMVLPEVVGYKLCGTPDKLITSTDIVLTVTKVIRISFTCLSHLNQCSIQCKIIRGMQRIFDPLVVSSLATFTRCPLLLYLALLTLSLIPLFSQHLRQVGVVGKFVEFFGPGVAQLSIADRATIANMCPEYGATAAFFPVDDVSIQYLEQTGERQAAECGDNAAECGDNVVWWLR